MWELRAECYLGKMRTEAWKAAPQVALRHCSEAAVEEPTYRILVKGSAVQWSAYFKLSFLLVTRSWCHHEGFSAFLDTRSYKDWDHEISSRKYLSKDLFHQFLWSIECLTLYPVFPSGGVEVQQMQQHRLMANAPVVVAHLLANAPGKCQFVVDCCILRAPWRLRWWSVVPCALLPPPLFCVSFILITHLYPHPANFFFFFY